jgi:hypothetical protein
MAEKVVSLKVAEEVVRDLEQIAQYYGTTRLVLAKKLLEEGLRKARLEYGRTCMAGERRRWSELRRWRG